MPDHATSPGTVEAWLSRDTADSAWRVVNARLKFPKHGQRLLPDSPAPIEEIFAPEIASLLESHLGTVRETAVFSHSDFSFRLPGLKIDGLRILTRVGQDGSATASIRFVRTVGDLRAMLQSGVFAGDAPSMDLDSLTLPMLQDLLRPALEVVDHILEHGLSDEDARVLTARVKTMRTKRDELSDYIDLLTRYAILPASRGEVPSLAGAKAEAESRIETHNTLHSRQIEWDPSTGTLRGAGGSILHGHHDMKRAVTP